MNGGAFGSGSAPASGSTMGTSVRIAATTAGVAFAFGGTVSADCRTMNLSLSMEGETYPITFRRR